MHDSQKNKHTRTHTRRAGLARLGFSEGLPVPRGAALGFGHGRGEREVAEVLHQALGILKAEASTGRRRHPLRGEGIHWKNIQKCPLATRGSGVGGPEWEINKESCSYVFKIFHTREMEPEMELQRSPPSPHSMFKGVGIHRNPSTTQFMLRASKAETTRSGIWATGQTHKSIQTKSVHQSTGKLVSFGFPLIGPPINPQKSWFP